MVLLIVFMARLWLLSFIFHIHIFCSSFIAFSISPARTIVLDLIFSQHLVFSIILFFILCNFICLGVRNLYRRGKWFQHHGFKFRPSTFLFSLSTNMLENVRNSSFSGEGQESRADGTLFLWLAEIPWKTTEFKSILKIDGLNDILP